MLNQGIRVRREGEVSIDAKWRPLGVTKQFLENAETYHARYFDNGYWRYLVARALDTLAIDRSAGLRILDIGSGSGNTVFAAAHLLPNAHIVASDISPQLLRLLAGIQHKEPSLLGRIETYCFDLHRDFFARDTFDLVIGGAILHHMLDPQAALTNVAKWMKPGARAVLFEPFEIGGHMMVIIYQTLISEFEDELDPRLLQFFQSMVQDYEARFGVPRVKPWTARLDDKWLFTPTYMRSLAQAIGLELEMMVANSDELSHLFRDSVRGTLNVSGNGALPVPPRLWSVLDEFDRDIAPALKHRLVPEGMIVLRK